MSPLHAATLIALAVVSAGGYVYAMVGLLVLDARAKR